MTSKMMTLAAIVLTAAHTASAQQPPRPNDTPRAVTLTLAEYNRLIDLASRPPQNPTTAPVAAVLASSELRVRVDRDTARGVFAVTGDAENWTPSRNSAGYIRYVTGLFHAADGFHFLAGESVTVGNAKLEVYVSPDGVNWEQKAKDVKSKSVLRRVAFGNGVHVAVGDRGRRLG